MKLVTEVPHLAKMCGIKTLVDKIRPEDYRSVYRLFKRADNAAVKKGRSAKLTDSDRMKYKLYDQSCCIE